MSQERTLVDLLQKMQSRCYGKYRGLVVDNEDPEQLGRLRMRVPSLLGTEVVTGWALPCVPYGGDANQGMLFIPEAGAGVWVEFEEGNLEFPIWTGTFWSKPDGDTELPVPNDADGEEQSDAQDPVTRKLIKTRKGHSIQLEDKDGEETVLVVHKTDGGGSNVIRMDNSGICITDFTGSRIEMSDSAFTITSKVAFTVDASGQAFEVKADAIDFTKA